MIRRFVHHPETGDLLVEFTTGRRYVYADVPAEEADAFRAAFSKGRYFNRRVRDQYRCREITEDL